jgi:type I restriction-modification system DNA methylase subunit
MNQQAKDFIKILERLQPSRHSHEIFSDWLVMSAASLYSYKKDAAIEEEYLAVAKNYAKEELEQHAHLLAITVEALENTEQDFLGEVFTAATLANSRNGQFFTPYHVSHMMAEMAMEEKDFPQNRVCKISDPCCGAGGMLIAGAMVMKNRGFDYQRDAFFVGQDIDHRCARMAFIQLSLLGMPAIIVCGNSLTMETYWQRETLGYYLSDMDFRLRSEKILELMRIMENPERVPESLNHIAIETELKSVPQRKLTQGELF